MPEIIPKGDDPPLRLGYGCKKDPSRQKKSGATQG
jgi:hypothetical protein